MFKRSAPERPLPDLFCVAFLGRFEGYFPTYSDLFVKNLNYLTWAVLKAHTNNRAGEVTLRSADPRDVPQVNFHYFDEGTNDQGEDLDSVVDGIRFVRKLTGKLKQQGFDRGGNAAWRTASVRRRVARLSSAPTPGAIMPRAVAPLVRANRTACSTARFACTGRRACAWWMPPCFRVFRAFSSSARST